MKIIIAGIGKVGMQLTKQLSAEGYDVTVVDINKGLLATVVERYDVIAVQGNCATLPTLMQAGVMDADLLITTTHGDEINLLSCMTAQSKNRKIQTIARIRNPDYAHQVHGMLDVFSLSMVINPERMAAREIERLLKYPGFTKRDTFAKGRVEIAELRVHKGDKLCDLSLHAIGTVTKASVLVCSVLRQGEALTPDGDFVLQEGDRIFVTGSTDALSTLLKDLGIITRKLRHVIICGGGRVSAYLAQALQKGDVSLHLLENRRERCEELAELLPNTHVVHGDASNEAVLHMEGLERCDALINMTGMDELNMVISLHGNRHGVPQVITKLSRVDTRSPMLTGLDLGSIICPKELCCNSVVRYVHAMENQAGAALSIHTIADGRAEAMEFEVGERTMHRGQPLKKLTLRPGIIVAAISRGLRSELANGDSTFDVGDVLIVVKSGDMVIHQLNDIFEYV